MTQLHAGGKFDQNSYKVSGGLHGVGVSVVNALSDWLELRIWREGYEHFARFEGGETVESLQRVGPAEGKRGTEVRFLASTDDVLEPRLQLQDAGAPAARARVPELGRADHAARRAACRGRGGRCSHYEGGVREFVRYLDRSKTPLIAAPIYIDGRARRHRRRGGDVVERQLPRDGAALHQQHPAARRRHASRGLPRRADPDDQRLCRRVAGWRRGRRWRSRATTRARG